MPPQEIYHNYNRVKPSVNLQNIDSINKLSLIEKSTFLDQFNKLTDIYFTDIETVTKIREQIDIALRSRNALNIPYFGEPLDEKGIFYGSVFKFDRLVFIKL